MVPGTETTFAGVVPVLVNRGAFETGVTRLVMAYPTSERSDRVQQGVRLDFRWVVQLQFTSFWGADPAEVSAIGAAGRVLALNVLDDSPQLAQFLEGYRDPEWERVFGTHRPADILRHFHIAFDDYGGYDVMAADCIARSFPLSPAPPREAEPAPAGRATAQHQDEERLLADAHLLDPVPPLLSYPIDTEH